MEQSAPCAPDTIHAGRSRSREGSIDNKVPCVSRRHFRSFEHSFISTEGDAGNSEDVFSTTLGHDPGTALGARKFRGVNSDTVHRLNRTSASLRTENLRDGSR